ncbi:MAG: Uncharacterized, RsbU-domain-containing protein [uncultured Quadrisphaera sp.]|uniref:Uncharacterized, RsbU-domain-containing protein n=1 Tax=uncultured Quadrisphaera sp. TaxID=904978 RepID=A0A6J4PM40_9ACTN|nr:MAG: Uncharacterized, RsbU-domain-containing protein [uncultured Quadrisphaera sp.]
MSETDAPSLPVGGEEEALRAAAARRLGEGPGAGPALDRLAGLAARLLGAGSAQVSLMSELQTIVGSAGMPAGMERRQETLDESLCTLPATAGAPLVVTDARADERVSAKPSVRAGLVGAYLGVPLTGGDGQVVGTLCVIDAAPRAWSEADLRVLEVLATSVVAELELSALSADVESSRLRWALAVDAAGIGTFDWDVGSGRLRWDERLLELFGHTEETFGGTIASFNERVHPEDLPGVSEEIARAVQACGEVDLEYRIVLPDGGVRWVRARGRALGGEDGRAVRLLGAAHDVTPRREADLQVARVLEAMSAAFYSLDRDWRFTYVNAEAERMLGREREELLGRSLWEAFPAAAGSVFEDTYREALASGRPRTAEAYYPAPLDGWFELRVWPGPDGIGVYFLDITARRRLQEQSERSTARLALVAEVVAELSVILDTATAVQRLAELVVPTLGDWCVVTLLDDDGRAREVGSWHVDPAQRGLVSAYARARRGELSRVPAAARSLLTGRATVVPQVPAAGMAEHLGEEAAELLARLAPGSALVVPLRGRGRSLGILGLGIRARGGQLADLSAEVAEDVAARAGLALDNLRLYDEQRRLAEGLQRSLLTDPPQPDHGQIVVRYRPAAQAAQVGGDWYDAFLQSDGATVLVIGDVVGHDTAAAAAMGQLRGLLRGIGYHTGAGPAEVLAGLDAAMAGLSIGTTATAVVARLEQTPEQLEQGLTVVRWSNAGHPPPFWITADGRVGSLSPERSDGTDLLLGIDPGTRRRERVVTLGRGATLLLFTDGLVERRDQGLDEGLALLHEVLVELADRPLDELCDEVLARLVPVRSEDDVALVAVRLHPQDEPRPAEAGPRRTPPGVPPPPDGALSGT